MSPRQLQAVFTALLLLLSYIAFVVTHDIATPPWGGLTDDELAEIPEANFKSNLIVIAIFGIPSFAWHVADVWPSSRPSHHLVSLILGYKTFCGILVLGLSGTALVFSGWTENFACRNTGVSDDGAFYTFCHPPPAYGIELFTFLPILIIVGLVITKAIFVAIDKPEREG